MQRLVFALGRQARVCASLGRVYTPRLTTPVCLFSTCAENDSQCGKACGQMCGSCHSRIVWNLCKLQRKRCAGIAITSRTASRVFAPLAIRFNLFTQKKREVATISNCSVCKVLFGPELSVGQKPTTLVLESWKQTLRIFRKWSIQTYFPPNLLYFVYMGLHDR